MFKQENCFSITRSCHCLFYLSWDWICNAVEFNNSPPLPPFTQLRLTPHQSTFTQSITSLQLWAARQFSTEQLAGLLHRFSDYLHTSSCFLNDLKEFIRPCWNGFIWFEKKRHGLSQHCTFQLSHKALQLFEKVRSHGCRPLLWSV